MNMLIDSLYRLLFSRRAKLWFLCQSVLSLRTEPEAEEGSKRGVGTTCGCEGLSCSAGATVCAHAVPVPLWASAAGLSSPPLLRCSYIRLLAAPQSDTPCMHHACARARNVRWRA
jgi:hypothetical protein